MCSCSLDNCLLEILFHHCNMEKIKKIWLKTNRWHIVITVLALAEFNLIPSGKLGFQCKDPALSHLFTGDTINIKWLLSVTALLPLLVMLLVERVVHSDVTTKENLKKQVLYWYTEYMYAWVLNLTIVQVLKICVGAPRPHFFDTCMPSEALTCEESQYVSAYTCTKAHWLSQSDKSFPSGHTSLAVQAALFTMCYLVRRAYGWRAAAGVAASAGAATGCAVSRLLDHRHHGRDVLAGAAVAVALHIYIMVYRCKNFKCIHPTAVEDAPDCETSRDPKLNNHF